MPGSAPAGTSVGTIGTVAPGAPDAPASPGSPLAKAGAANTRVRTTVAKAVAGAVDRRRDVVVVLPPVCETAQVIGWFRERRPDHDARRYGTEFGRRIGARAARD